MVSMISDSGVTTHIAVTTDVAVATDVAERKTIFAYSFCVNSVEKAYSKACINNVRKNNANKEENIKKKHLNLDLVVA